MKQRRKKLDVMKITCLRTFCRDTRLNRVINKGVGRIVDVKEEMSARFDRIFSYYLGKWSEHMRKDLLAGKP